METKTPDRKKEKVEAMFDHIAYRYDFLNRFLSFGFDICWRKRLVREAKKLEHAKILDVATGTADLAISLARCRPELIVGIDISKEMLNIGKIKIEKKGLSPLIQLEQADSESLPFESNAFDLVTAAFGVRNFENLVKGLSEMCRVLRPGGSTLILEFSQVTRAPWKQLFNFYFRFILPLLGRLISKHHFAYSYLPESVDHFPSGEDFLDQLRLAGYDKGRQIKMTGGVASLYVAKKGNTKSF